MNNNMLKLILIFGIFLTLIGCSQEPKICASKAAEEELIKKATEQGLIPKENAKKIKFTIISVEESKVAANSQDGNSAKITICNARAKLEYIDEVQNSYKEIKKLIKTSYEFAEPYFNNEVSSVKYIEFKIKKNELNGGVIIDGDWQELDEQEYLIAQPLSERIIDIIENKDTIIKEFNDIAVLWKFHEFLVDPKTDIAKTGKNAKEYILNNKIPILYCQHNVTENNENIFTCRIANEHSAMNINLYYGDDFNEIIDQVFEGKKPKSQIRDTRIEPLIEKAIHVQQGIIKDGTDFIETFKLLIFKSIKIN